MGINYMDCGYLGSKKIWWYISRVNSNQIFKVFLKKKIAEKHIQQTDFYIIFVC
jgi:hypothetical protein